MHIRTIRRSSLVVSCALTMVAAGCGGDDDTSPADEPAADGADTGDSAGDSGGSSGQIADAPPSGQARLVVDGLDLTFDLPGGLACSISNESITYSYRIGDNEVTLGAGLNADGDGWMGNIAVSVANPDGEPGPIGYYPAPGALGVLDGSLFTIDGRSAQYSGPMLKQPANDGSLPEPVDVGVGTVTATC